MPNEAFRQYRSDVASQYGDWQWSASCQGSDPGQFFPDGVVAQRAVANAVCINCAVRFECLEYAIVMEENIDNKAVMARMGVWGGLAVSDRKRLARHLRETLPVWPPSTSLIDTLEEHCAELPVRRAVRYAS